MYPPVSSIPKRPVFTERVLSNSAAEFVELRAGREICRRATGGLVNVAEEPNSKIADETGNEEVLGVTVEAPKFVSAFDCFVPRDEVPDFAACYEESSEMRMKFRETLKSFTKTLKSRKIFEKLNVEDRDPADFDLNYVLKIASRIQEHKEGLDNTRTIKNFIQKCFRGANKHKAVLTGIFSMVPDDIYGSVISGGFSLILAAVESHEKLRAEIQSTLADVPRRLNNVQRLSRAHTQSMELHHCADQVFLSIFIVLERIIAKLSRNWVENTKHKFKGHGDDINEAIEALGEKITEFQNEVDICAQQRLGRVEDKVQRTWSILEKKLGDIEKKLPSTDEPSSKQMLSEVFNWLYILFASNPGFDPVTGTDDGHVQFARIAQLQPAQILHLSQAKLDQGSLPLSRGFVRPNSTGSIIFSFDKAKELADTWLAALRSFDPMPEKQITECLSGFAELSLEEKDRAQWIMASDEVRKWLALTKSTILDVRLDTAPEELVNAVSSSAATLALTLASATDFAVLSFFCGLRRKESRDNADSGPRAVWNSLNGQLLKSMLDKRATANLSFLERENMMRKSRGKSQYAKELFRELLGALPEGDVVFVILDSFSLLGGEDRAKGDDIIEELAALVAEMPQLVIKVLVTDALASCPVKRLADSTLYVPDEVDGWKNDTNLAFIEEMNRAGIKPLFERQQKGCSTLEASDSSSDSDSD